VTVGLRLARIGRSSLRYELAVFRNDDDEAAAEGHFVHVYVDRANQRPVPLPDAVRAAVAGLLIRAS
jgi:acyl-CoA thioester hydrolase